MNGTPSNAPSSRLGFRFTSENPFRNLLAVLACPIRQRADIRLVFLLQICPNLQPPTNKLIKHEQQMPRERLVARFPSLPILVDSAESSADPPSTVQCLET